MKWFSEFLYKREEILAEQARLSRKTADAFTSKIQTVEQHFADHLEVEINRATEDLRKDRDRWKKRALKAEEFIASQEEPKVATDQVALARAKTFAIVDSILFAIENWATDASPAPDITLASQATLFPVFLEEVSKGDENYYLTEVPDAAIEVVRRGREFVKDFREREQISVLDRNGWDILQPVLHDWWTRDAMPMMYGASLAEWQHETPYSRDQMIKWKDLELSRAMDFPLIFDGYELVSKYGDEIREETGLPEFNKQVMKTRFTTNG